MTPKDLQIYARAYAERLKDEGKADRALSYLQSALIRTMVWAKHPPSYSRVFPDDVKREDMTDEQIYEQVKAFNKLFGGTEEA